MGAIESEIDRYLRGEEGYSDQVDGYQRYFDTVRQAHLAEEIAKGVLLGGNSPKTPADSHLVQDLAALVQPWVRELLLVNTERLAELASDYEIGLSWAEWTEPPEPEYDRAGHRDEIPY